MTSYCKQLLPLLLGTVGMLFSGAHAAARNSETSLKPEDTAKRAYRVWFANTHPRSKSHYTPVDQSDLFS